MDCGIPFCHQGCPLGNLIPDWNDLVYRDHWRAAIDRLHATNNFPEFTGRALPRAVRRLVRARHQRGSGHDQVDRGVDRRSRVRRRLDRRRSRRRRARGRKWPSSARDRPASPPPRSSIAPATASPCSRSRDRIGGLLRYGIPEFKMEKRVLDRRLDADGRGRRGVPRRVNVGVDVTVDDLRRDFDAVLLAGGADSPRDLPCPAASSRASTSRWIS